MRPGYFPRTPADQRMGIRIFRADLKGHRSFAASVGAHVTPRHVDSYVAELKERVSSVMVYDSIQKLRRTCN
jgi:hypothetical protein